MYISPAVASVSFGRFPVFAKSETHATMASSQRASDQRPLKRARHHDNVPSSTPAIVGHIFIEDGITGKKDPTKKVCMHRQLTACDSSSGIL